MTLFQLQIIINIITFISLKICCAKYTFEEVELSEKIPLCKQLIFKILADAGDSIPEESKQTGQTVVISYKPLQELVWKLFALGGRKILIESKQCKFQDMNDFTLSLADVKQLFGSAGSSSVVPSNLAPNSNSKDPTDQLLADSGLFLGFGGGFRPKLLGALFTKMLFGAVARIVSHWQGAALRLLLRTFACFKFGAELEKESFVNFVLEPVNFETKLAWSVKSLKVSERCEPERCRIQYNNFQFLHTQLFDNGHRKYTPVQLAKLIDTLISVHFCTNNSTGSNNIASSSSSKNVHLDSPVFELYHSIVGKFSLLNNPTMADRCAAAAFILDFKYTFEMEKNQNYFNQIPPLKRQIDEDFGKLTDMINYSELANCEQLNDPKNEKLKAELLNKELLIRFQNAIDIDWNEIKALFEHLSEKFGQFKLLDETDECYGQKCEELAALIPRKFQNNRWNEILVDNVKNLIDERSRPLYRQIRQTGQELGARSVLAGKLTFENCAAGLDQLIRELETGLGPAVQRLNMLVLDAHADLKGRNATNAKGHLKKVTELLELVEKASTDGEALIQKAKKTHKTVQADGVPRGFSVAALKFRQALGRLDAERAQLVALLRDKIAAAAIALPTTIAEPEAFHRQMEEVLAKMDKNQ